MNSPWQLAFFYLTTLTAALTTPSLPPKARSSYAPLPIQDQICGFPSAKSINSTGTNTTLNPFILPQGTFNTTARNWTWTLATTTTGPNHEAIDNIQQKLFLSVHPDIDLTSNKLTPSKPGCGVVFHGLNHDALLRGQNDLGNCRSMLSDQCIRALRSQTHNFDDNCVWNTTSSSQKPPGECTDYFNPSINIQTFTFASSNQSSLCPSSSSSASNSRPNNNTNTQILPSLPSAHIVASWGYSPFVHNYTYLSPQGLSRTPYDNLSTLVSPIMVHLGAGDEGQLFCMRSSRVNNGSSKPGAVPGTSEQPWWVMVVELLGITCLVSLALI